MKKLCTLCGKQAVTKGMCQKHYDAARYAADPEKSNAQHRRFIANNPQYHAEYRKRKVDVLKENQKRWYEKDKEHARALNRATHQRNKEKRNEYSRAYRAANLERVRELSRNWHAANPAKHRLHMATRKAAKLNATPGWAHEELDEFIREEMYDLAARRTAATGIEWHVDHIVPLKSKTVCGLHCSANLQVIPRLDNQKKGNRVWPNMP